MSEMYEAVVFGASESAARAPVSSVASTEKVRLVRLNERPPSSTTAGSVCGTLSSANGAGGIELFLALHVFLVAPFLVGLARLARRARAGVPFGIALSAAGIAGFVIHSVLLLRGGSEFRSIASVALVVLMLLTSVPLLIVSLRVARNAGTSR